MAKKFYSRLKCYFERVGEVLRGEADAASIFPNTTDVGMSRESTYAEFLRQHTPSKCNIYLGGFLFGEDGTESKQLDIIISTDTAQRYDFHNSNGLGKSFGSVEGCLGVASIKSKLDKTQLIDSLYGISSIPATQELGGRINPSLRFSDYDDWPLKIIYASDGLKDSTILAHIDEFYCENPEIPLNRRPDIIHVAGKYAIFRIKKGMSITNLNGGTKQSQIGRYHSFVTNSDMQAMIWTLDELQKRATISTHIIFNYSGMINKLNGLVE